MVNQTLMIAIGFTCLTTILLFLYYKRKITSIEYKLDSLFTLIEEHTQEKKRINVQENNLQKNMEHQETPHNINDESKIINLIPVSDNEIETDSEEEFTTDGESESEQSDGEQSCRQEKEKIAQEDNFELIHLEIPDTPKEELQEGTNVTKLDDYDTLEFTDDILNYGVVIEELEELEELESDFDESSLDSSSKKNIEIELNKELQTELQKELQNLNLQKLKVHTLRDIADKYNLHENSKKIKKDELIQLLQKYM